jgi:hypothetical protein
MVTPKDLYLGEEVFGAILDGDRHPIAACVHQTGVSQIGLSQMEIGSGTRSAVTRREFAEELEAPVLFIGSDW